MEGFRCATPPTGDWPAAVGYTSSGSASGEEEAAGDEADRFARHGRYFAESRQDPRGGRRSAPGARGPSVPGLPLWVLEQATAGGPRSSASGGPARPPPRQSPAQSPEKSPQRSQQRTPEIMWDYLPGLSPEERWTQLKRRYKDDAHERLSRRRASDPVAGRAVGPEGAPEDWQPEGAPPRRVQWLPPGAKGEQ